MSESHIFTSSHWKCCPSSVFLQNYWIILSNEDTISPFLGKSLGKQGTFPYKKMGIEMGRRRIRVLCPSCVLPWESIELDCKWLKRVPFAHMSATREFFPSHVPSYHFSILFHMKNRDLALLKKEKILYLYRVIHHMQSAALPALNCPKEKNKTKHSNWFNVQPECSQLSKKWKY